MADSGQLDWGDLEQVVACPGVTAAKAEAALAAYPKRLEETLLWPMVRPQTPPLSDGEEEEEDDESEEHDF